MSRNSPIHVLTRPTEVWSVEEPAMVRTSWIRIIWRSYGVAFTARSSGSAKQGATARVTEAKRKSAFLEMEKLIGLIVTIITGSNGHATLGPLCRGRPLISSPSGLKQAVFPAGCGLFEYSRRTCAKSSRAAHNSILAFYDPNHFTLEKSPRCP